MNVTPDLIKRYCGGWLAVTPEGAPLRLGAEGASEQEAADAYQRERAIWIDILSRVDQSLVSGR